MLVSEHRVVFGDARDVSLYAPESVDLVLTSPPYPMIGMWDGAFAELNPRIAEFLDLDPLQAFETMHVELDRVWEHCAGALKPGGFMAINIGDATRTLQDQFRLFPNHARIIQSCMRLGLSPLPLILWRKQTNAPNKFMGSGMLPAGAYVTLEHEYILIFRKGGKREFKSAADKLRRQASALFWEERNRWFSDVWLDLKGARQDLDSGARDRSAAFPFELAYRLIHMFSVRGDRVLDPFLGTGTTTLAAVASGRDSIGIERETDFQATIRERMLGSEQSLNDYIARRLGRHLEFVRERLEAGRPIKHENEYYGFPVITAQEKKLQLYKLESISLNKQNFVGKYTKMIPEPSVPIRESEDPSSFSHKLKKQSW